MTFTSMSAARLLMMPCVAVLPSCDQAVTDETLKKLDATYLRDMKLQGVEKIQKVGRGRGGGRGPLSRWICTAAAAALLA
jgi:hypothetical protein